jgi:voltage-dependent potassium channel beta subunit
MEYRRLGRAGLKVSALSFGSWITFGNQMNSAAARECMAEAFDAGVNFFDNAEVYANGESERIMGELLHAFAWPRDRYCVSSKVFWGGEHPTQRGLSRKHVTEACEAALRRLRVDYLDLYFCHRPDPETPIEETVRAMNTLIAQGKVLYWGTSEWPAEALREAYAVADQLGLQGPSMEQPEYNLFHRERVEREYASLYAERGLGTTVWSPLASGILTGKYNAGIPRDSRVNVPGYEWLRERLQSPVGQAKLARARELDVVAQELGTSLTRLSLAWCLKNPHVSTVILGASRVEQLTDNLQALAVVPQLTAPVMKRIENIVAAPLPTGA